MEDGQRFDPINAFIVGPLPRSGLWVMKVTHRLLSGSFSGLPYRILNMNHKKELLRSLWAGFK